MALGGKPKDKIKPPDTLAEAEVQFNNIFGNKG